MPIATRAVTPLTRISNRLVSTKQYSEDFGDHSWRQQNHIWTEREIAERMETADLKHVPQNTSEFVLQKLVRVAYHSFNYVTGYQAADPPPKSIGYRLIILESVAGVPGMLGGMFRHFRSLRQLERDHGFIFTLLEEAENERMHLITCMGFFEAGPLTRVVVSAGQLAMTPFLAGLYIVRPQLLHRFVGCASLSNARCRLSDTPEPRACEPTLGSYLEETAVHTYTNIVTMAETPGTQLHTAWNDVPAPDVAINYWQMSDDATWVDCLKRMLADESHHRDVNHALASMPHEKLFGNDNPFVHEHIADYEKGVKRRAERALKRALEEVEGAEAHKTRSDKALA